VGGTRVAITHKITRIESTRSKNKPNMFLKPHLQQTLLDIHNFKTANGRMPTITELAKVSRGNRGNLMSIGCIQQRINQLVATGYLVRLVRDGRGIARTMRFGQQINIIDGKIPVLGVCN
jgi:hypothetical protein